MTYLVDSSVFLRHTNAADALYSMANNMLESLHNQGENLRTTPQIFVEFRSVATRPTDVNGLGLSASEAEAKAAIYEAAFSILPETPDIFPAWKTLVQAAGVTGKQVHDARLVAICHVYGISHILTFNVRHFARLAIFAPGVVIIDPQSI